MEATAHYEDADLLARVSEDLGEPMVGVGASELRDEQLLAARGW